MKWLVADSLYCREQFFCSHLDSYSYYLNEAGEFVRYRCLNLPIGATASEVDYSGFDVVFALDQYDRCANMVDDTEIRVKRIAQVAAVCNPMPWEVRKPDGSPAFDFVLSSIPWMVDAARAAGCRAEYMPLAFDTRARVCGMGVKRDIPCLFVGTRGPNHQRREEILGQLGRLVTVAPPTFGRDYFRLLARAKSVLHCGAEWARGAMNAMRCTEAMGMWSLLIVDAPTEGLDRFADGVECVWYKTADKVRDAIAMVDSPALREIAEIGFRRTLVRETYESRIPRLIDLVRSL